MKTLLLCTLALALSACAGFDPSKFENRVVCTVAKDKAFVVSEYGPAGISSKIAAADQAVICK